MGHVLLELGIFQAQLIYYSFGPNCHEQPRIMTTIRHIFCHVRAK